MTVIYFVRHAEPDHSIKDERTRPLSSEGTRDSEQLIDVFKNIHVDSFYSSPYKRSFETILPTAKYFHKTIVTEERFRERRPGINSNHQDMFEKQWHDLDFHEPDGESIREVQKRNIEALHDVIHEHANKLLVIGTHGTALSSMLNYYDSRFGYADFMRIINWMPYILRMVFEGKTLIEREEVYYLQKVYS